MSACEHKPTLMDNGEICYASYVSPPAVGFQAGRPYLVTAVSFCVRCGALVAFVTADGGPWKAYAPEAPTGEKE